MAKHHIKRAGVFGSFAKGTFHKKSDVDMLVELPKGFDLLTFVSMKLELQESLKRHVDIGAFNTIRPQLRDRILNETIIILDEK
ncbi:MAG: nucleotidyltransferase family protein [Spirosomataceae bacterium]